MLDEYFKNIYHFIFELDNSMVYLNQHVFVHPS